MQHLLHTGLWARHGMLLILFCALGACSSSGSQSSTTSVENSGANCPVPPLAEAEQLLIIAQLPDPFTSLNGERITRREQWRCQRQQTNAMVQHYEAGTKPLKPAQVSGSVKRESITVDVTHQGQQIRFNASVTLPTTGAAPYPAIMGIGASSLDNDYLARQGIAIITIDNNAL
ncbi:MAG TPA: hypothetical protein VIC08_01030, partial [Cellvibrionaceae bacterium]